MKSLIQLICNVEKIKHIIYAVKSFYIWRLFDMLLTIDYNEEEKNTSSLPHEVYDVGGLDCGIIGYYVLCIPENHTVNIWNITLQWFVLISEARHLAITYNCKYIETSATLNHHVNELLVGILTQIKLKLNPDLTVEKNTSVSRDTTCFKGLFNRLFHLKPNVQTTFNVF